MKTIIEYTQFLDSSDGVTELDINYLLLQKYNNPIIIATRTSQILRIIKWEVTNDIIKPIMGWWNLSDREYVTTNYNLNKKNWLQHDAAIFLDPNRCIHKEMYLKLAETVSKI